jgi:cytolethal distending toxin subunit A
MTIFHRAPAGLVTSGVFALGLYAAASGVAHAAPVINEVMLINSKTSKCVTIAGGVNPANNVPSVQFDCDNDPSRRWTLHETTSGIYQVRNVQTGKCLTIAGGESSDNNVPAVQFDCDNHPSRTWRISDVTGSGVNQLRNVRTNKCLTIEGGTLDTNNLPTVQFDCDTDQSRRWTIRLKL